MNVNERHLKFKLLDRNRHLKNYFEKFFALSMIIQGVFFGVVVLEPI